MESLRTAVAARLSAVWLIVLIASPWTAPFATCDLAAGSRQPSTGTATVAPAAGSVASRRDPTGSVIPPPEFPVGQLHIDHESQLRISTRTRRRTRRQVSAMEVAPLFGAVSRFTGSHQVRSLLALDPAGPSTASPVLRL